MDSKGMSPVITTIIIVAVGIPLAIAVGIWMGGLVTTYTRSERLEMTQAIASMEGGTFTIIANFTNKGSSDTTVTELMINEKPYYSWSGATVSPALPLAAPTGEGLSLKVQFPNRSTDGNALLTSGLTVTIALRTSGGVEYSRMVVLP
jgi:FlaG/FlaF family flagellin (archaellin)